MSIMLREPVFRRRDDGAFLAEMQALTRHHIAGCPGYAGLFAHTPPATSVETLPFLHVGLFKALSLTTTAAGIVHERTLQSSSTSGIGSRITLDRRSSDLQGQSSHFILRDFVGTDQRPLIVIDSRRSLPRRGEVSARVAAAMSLRPLASEIHFALEWADDPRSLKLDLLRDVLNRHDAFYVYGFSWILWLALGAQPLPDELRQLLKGKKVTFVHSGGWKHLEALKVDRAAFDATLLADLAAGSSVVDYYGLVEQVGVIFPLCRHGCRHVPVWADVLVRDPLSLASLTGAPGLLQLMNVLAYGAPYHNILTEDLGQIELGPCPCGREGKRFTLLGRLPNADVRGCANV